jgi:hypothetical protein
MHVNSLPLCFAETDSRRDLRRGGQTAAGAYITPKKKEKGRPKPPKQKAPVGMGLTGAKLFMQLPLMEHRYPTRTARASQLEAAEAGRLAM